MKMEKGMTTHSSVLAWRILWREEPGGLQPWGHKESDTSEQLTLTLKNEKNLKSTYLILQFKKLERKKKTKCKASRRKKIIKTRAELTKIEK